MNKPFLLSLSLICALTFGGFTAPEALAIDISPSKETVPSKFRNNSAGKRFSIFSGDPKRIQRANEIKVSDFKATVRTEPGTLSLTATTDDGDPAYFEAVLKVTNKAKKRNYTLSFPDSQRFDFAIGTSKQNVFYQWSEDKFFTEDVGTSFLNAGEFIAFRQRISAKDLRGKVVPGKYRLLAVLANYPELYAETEITITP